MNKTIHEDLKKATEETIKKLLEENQGEVDMNNLEPLGELMDIHKDIANEEYWCIKEEKEMYGEYNNYNEYGARRSGRRGGYNEYGNYNEYGARRRDSRGRYRGDEYMDRMGEEYGRYMEDRERYGASEDTMRSLQYMLKSMEDFARMLKEEASSEQEVQMIRETAQRIAQM